MRIPINFQDARRNELRELLLFASWDQGRSYQQVASVMPDKSEFAFEARNDGMCWLKVAVTNRLGKQEPDNIQQGPPDRKVVIDTMKPVLRAFTAQRQGEQVAVSWDILEEHFDPQGFRLEYQPTGNTSAFWTTIPATPSLTGQTTFRPTSAGPLSVRLIVKDQAGNQSFGGAEVGGGVNTIGYNPPAPAPTPAAAPAELSPAVMPPPAPPPSSFGINTAAAPPLEAAKQPPPPPSGSWNPVAAPEPKDRLVATSQVPVAPAPRRPCRPPT